MINPRSKIDPVKNSVEERKGRPKNSALVERNRFLLFSHVFAVCQHKANLCGLEEQILSDVWVAHKGSTPLPTDTSRSEDALERQTTDDVAEQFSGRESCTSSFVRRRRYGRVGLSSGDGDLRNGSHTMRRKRFLDGPADNGETTRTLLLLVLLRWP